MRVRLCTLNPLHRNLENNYVNYLNAALYPICHLLALLRAHHIIHVSRVRVKYCYSGLSMIHCMLPKKNLM